MKKIYILLAALAALMFASSCARDEGKLDPHMRKVSVKAKVAQTKAVLSGSDVVWEDGDAISLVFSHSSAASHVCALTTSLDGDKATSSAKFRGTILKEVTPDNGYDESGFAVYPSSAVDERGALVFSLPAEQTAAAAVDNFAGIQSGLNLTSGVVSLEKIVAKGETEAEFRNACSIVRFTLDDDVTAMTIGGTANLAGQAPLLLDDDGRLVIDADGQWKEASKSVTLLPSEGDCFKSGVVYNLLVWPGTHSALTLSVNYKGLGEVSKTAQMAVTFAPSKYYTLNFNPSSEELVKELTGAIGEVIGGLSEFEENLDSVGKEVAELLGQVQSVTLMTEYLDNFAYAPYGVFNSGMQKLDVSLDYIIKPESAAEALVEAFDADPSILKGVLAYSGQNGLELTETELAVNSLVLSEAPGLGKYVTAGVAAWNISNDFYNGKIGASVALKIASGKTEILSDFAALVPKAGSGFSGTYIKDIPAVPGARVVIPFTFAVQDAGYTLEVKSSQNVENAYLNYNTDFRTGNLSVTISESKPIESQKVTLALNVGSEEILQEFTFVDSGARINLIDPGKADYIGGDLVLEVESQGVKNYMLSCSGAGVSQSGNIFTFPENTGAERSATVECQATLLTGSLNYYKSIALTQKAYGTSLSRSYYTNGQKVVLNQATASGCSNYFNIVILGDGYKKKDLAVGGKFERSARSAMDTFFAVEPYLTFKDRFNVYMVAYESADEGTDIKSSGVEKNTYFGGYCQGGGNTAAYVADTAPVINAVKAAVGSADAQYYRSIAILLINTDEPSGSTGYPYRNTTSGFVNGYSSFAIAVLAANSTGTNGLVKHEAGGHAFGRLADEYYTNGNTASSSNKTDLSNWHAKGWYWNVNPTNSGNYYKFTNSAYSSAEVGFIEGAWGYQYGMYRPTAGGMMQGSTGVFNAPSRHAIYHRIITESEGANAYSWSKFLDYDQKNR